MKEVKRTLILFQVYSVSWEQSFFVVFRLSASDLLGLLVANLDSWSSLHYQNLLNFGFGGNTQFYEVPQVIFVH